MGVKRTKLLFLAVMTLGLGASVAVIPFLPWLVRLLESSTPLGLCGVLALGGLHTVSCVFLIPGSMPTLAGGFLLGVLVGSITAIVGSTVGACTAFLIGRSVARDWIADKIAHHPKFTAIDRAIGQHGFRVVLLSRLSPISPFIFLNYILGLTQVSFWEYTWGTLLGITPGTVLFVYFGAGLRSLAEVIAYAQGQGPVPAGHHAFLWGSLAVTVVVTIVLTRMARDALRKVILESTAENYTYRRE